MPKYTKKQAKKDSLIKWNYVKKTGCSSGHLHHWLVDKHPDIFYLQSCCGICHYRAYTRNTFSICRLCIFKKKGQCCGEEDSLFDRYEGLDCVCVDADIIKQRKGIARKIIKIIEEW